MKLRLDQCLVARGLCESREQGKRLIMTGDVLVNDQPVTKPGQVIRDDAQIRIKEPPKYVSRGGFKLEGALDHFGISPEGKTCMDVGASTGGFTDCLLQRGATKVYAFDVGTNQLVWKLRQDARVIAREKVNARHLTPADLPEGERINLLVADLSFISLTLVLPAVLPLIAPGGDAVVLVKPQFELSREEVGKGGIVREPASWEKACRKIEDFIKANPAWQWKGLKESPITGTDGNHEYLAWIGV